MEFCEHCFKFQCWIFPLQIKTNEIEGMNVYKFLNMVKGLANGEEETNACLGEDIDDLFDDENGDFDMSPQHASGFDAVFDETFELPNGSTSNGWDSNKDQIDQTNSNSNDWSGWGQNKSDLQVDVIQEDSSKSSAWGAATNQNSDQWGKAKSVVQEDSSKSGAWGTATNQDSEQPSWGKAKSVVQEDTSKSSAWGAATNQISDQWGKAKSVVQEDSSKSGAWGAATNQDSEQPCWGKAKPVVQEDSSKSSAWGTATNQNSEQPSWGKNKSAAPEDSSKSSAWGAATNQSSDHPWAKTTSAAPDGAVKNTQWESGSSQKWKSDAIQEDSSKSGAWETNKNQNSDKSWGTKKSGIQDDRAEKANWESGSSQKWKAVVQEDSSKSGAWEANTNQSSDSSCWGQITGVHAEEEGRAQGESGGLKWKADVTQEDSTNSGGWKAWGSSKPEIHEGESIKVQDSWNSEKWKAGADVTQEDSQKSSAWGATKPKSNDNRSSWGQKKDEIHVMPEDSSRSNAWEQKTENVKGGWVAKVPVANSSWGKAKSPEDLPWESKNESNQTAGSRGWDSQVASANSESDRSFQWGKQGRDSFKKNRFEGSQSGGPNAGDWKNRSRPARPPGQRFELYTPEEQDIMKDIEPIVQSIRRIMQLQG